MPQYWEGIRARIREEQLGPWIRQEGWTTGRATYQNIDVLLMTSKTPDPAPLVVPEAMSAGVIVAGYPAGGIPGMIEDERTGFIVEDGAALVKKLQSLLAEPNGIERIRSAAYAAVTRDYSMARFHAELRDCYLAMIA
jgi:glycosyltransferase involved in cell wall biosynthesis